MESDSLEMIEIMETIAKIISIFRRLVNNIQ